MKIIISGKDRTADLGSQIAEGAAGRMKDPRCAFLPWSLNALSLRDAKGAGIYYDRFLQLLRAKHHVGTLDFDVPRRPGLIGSVQGMVRSFLWKLLRYQHDRITFRQNLINSQLVSALEFEREEMKKIADRFAELEKRLGHR